MLPPGLFLAPPLLALACAAPATAPGPPVGPAAPQAPDAATLAALQLLTAGARDVSDGRAAEALPNLDAYLEQVPDSGLAWFLRGVALIDLDRLDDACEALATSVRLDPDDASGYAVLARVQYDLGRLDDAVETLRAAVVVDPDAERAWGSLGTVLLDQGEWAEAYEALTTAVRLDPTDADVHRALGRLYVVLDEPALAERAYRTALQMGPDDPALRVALGHVLRDLGRQDEAVAAYEAAARLDPGDPWIEANLGSTWLELHRPDRARPHLEQALLTLGDAGGADVAAVHANYALLLQQLGDRDGARLAYEESLALDPERGSAHQALGLMDLDAGDDASAREHLQAAFELAALTPEGLVELVLLHERAGESEAAWRCALPLLLAQGDGGELDWRRAQLQVRARDTRLHDPAAAAATLRDLLDGAYHESSAAWMLLAEALADQGDLTGAVDALETALGESGPDDPLHRRAAAQRRALLSRLAER